MAGLGPRVGGAHVDTSLQFDPDSLKKIKAQIHKQLSDLSKRSRNIFQRQFEEMMGTAQVIIGHIVALMPVLASAISAVGGAFVALSASVYNASKSLYGFVGVLGATGVALGTAILGFKGFGKAISADSPEELEKALKDLSPAARKAVLAVRGLSDEAKRLRMTVQERMFRGLSGEIKQLGNTLFPVLERSLRRSADALNLMFDSLLKYANSSAGLKTLERTLSGSADIFRTLAKTAVPFLDGMLKAYNALIPAGERMAERIRGISVRFQEWASAPGFAKRIDDQMKSSENSAGLLMKMLGNLGKAFGNIFKAATPAGDEFMRILVGVTERFKVFTGSAEGQNAIAGWASAGVEVMKHLGGVLSEFGKFFAAASDPKIIIGLLDALEEMFVILNKLPLEKMSSMLGDFLQNNSKGIGVILAMVAALSGFKVIAGYLLVTLGNLAGVFLSLGKGKGGIASLFGMIEKGPKKGNRIAGYAKMSDELLAGMKSIPSKLGKAGGAFSKFGKILGVGLKFAGWAGLAIWIGTIIAKSEKLRGKFGGVLDSIGGAFKKLTGAFKEITSALEPVFKGMDKLTPVFEFIIGLILDGMIYAFDSLGNVFEGVGKIIGGFIGMITSLFTGDWGGVADGFKKMVSGIWPLVKGLFGLFITFFAPARLAKIGLVAVKGLLGGFMRAIPAMMRGLFSLLSKGFSLLLKYGPVMATIGIRLVVFLAKALISKIPLIVSSLGRLLGSVGGVLGRLPGIALNWGLKVVPKLALAILRGVVRARSAATKIVNTVKDKIAEIPGKMLSIGKNIISKLVDGILASIGKIKGAMGKVGDKIKGFFPGSPVKEGPLTAWNYGGDASGGGRNLIRSIADGLSDVDPITNAMSGVANAVAGVAFGSKAGPTSASGQVTNNRELNVTINNPVRERGSDSLTRTARDLAYLGVV